MFSDLRNLAGCCLLGFSAVAGWEVSSRLTQQHINMLIIVIGALFFALVGGLAIGIGISMAGGRTKRASEPRQGGYGPIQPFYPSGQPGHTPQPQPHQLGSFTLKDNSGWV